MAIFTWSDNVARPARGGQSGKKKSGGKSGLVGSRGKKYCDAVKCWRFEILPRVTKGNFVQVTLDRQAKHQYSAASGAQARRDKASGDRIGRI